MKRFGVIAAVAGALLVLSAPAPAAPPGPPPGGGATWPPPAWVEIGQRSAWLAYAAFCWDSNCVRFRSPAQRQDIPRVAGLRGHVARLHFGFAPRQVTVTPVSGTTAAQAQQLKPGRVVVWRVRQTGLVLVNVNVAGRGTVSYAVNLRP